MYILWLIIDFVCLPFYIKIGYLWVSNIGLIMMKLVWWRERLYYSKLIINLVYQLYGGLNYLLLLSYHFYSTINFIVGKYCGLTVTFILISFRDPLLRTSRNLFRAFRRLIKVPFLRASRVTFVSPDLFDGTYYNVFQRVVFSFDERYRHTECCSPLPRNAPRRNRRRPTVL